MAAVFLVQLTLISVASLAEAPPVPTGSLQAAPTPTPAREKYSIPGCFGIFASMLLRSRKTEKIVKIGKYGKMKMKTPV